MNVTHIMVMPMNEIIINAVTLMLRQSCYEHEHIPVNENATCSQLDCGYIHVTALMGMEMDMTHVHECCNIKEALSYMLEDY